jgi:hypothetical protein
MGLEEEIHDLKTRIAVLEGDNLRRSAARSRAEAEVLRLRKEIADLRDQTRNTAPGKEPMQVDGPPSPERSRSVTPDGNGASSSRDRRTENLDVRLARESNVTEGFAPPVMVEIPDLEKLSKELWPVKRYGELYPFPEGPLGYGRKVIAPLKSKNADQRELWVELITPCCKYGKGLIYPHRVNKMRKVDEGRTQCSKCGFHKRDHECVSLRALNHMAKKLKLPSVDCTELEREIKLRMSATNGESGDEFGGESSEEADMDLHGNSNGEHQGESDEDSDMEREDELDGNSNRKPDGFSSEDSEQEED